jgi:hypothetical protein
VTVPVPYIAVLRAPPEDKKLRGEIFFCSKKASHFFLDVTIDFLAAGLQRHEFNFFSSHLFVFQVQKTGWGFRIWIGDPMLG